MLLVIAALFMQTVIQPVPTDEVPDQLARTMTDANVDGQIDLAFADGTLWSLTPLQGCDWLRPDLEVIWSPSADGSVSTIVQIGGNEFCYADTAVLP